MDLRESTCVGTVVRYGECMTKIATILILICVTFALPPSVAAAPDSPAIDWTDHSAIDGLIDDVIGRAELGRFRGAVVIRVGNETVFARGYGLENSELRPIDPGISLFDVGSVAKSVTAATVLRLVEEEKLTLSTTIDEVFGESAGSLADVTIEELLRHRSGLGAAGSALSQPGAMDSADGLIAALAGVALGSKRFAYSNAGYFVLAAVIEKVGDGSFETVTRELVFEPAGLSGVGFVGDGEVPGARPTARVSRASRGLPSIRPMFDYPWNWAQRGATGVLMTAEAAADWLDAIEDGEWLTQESRESMLGPSTDGYGLGLYVDVDEEGRVSRFWHGGLTGGFACHVARFPSAADGKGASVVLMAESSIDLGPIAKQIRSLIAPAPAKPTFAGIYLSRYSGLDEDGVFSIEEDLRWAGMPQYVGSDGTRRITDDRPTLILDDTARRIWPLMIRLDEAKAEQLLNDLTRASTAIADDPVGGQTPWWKGLTFVADVRGLKLTEFDSFVVDDGAVLAVRTSADHHVELVVLTSDGKREFARVRMGGAETRSLQEQIRRAMR